MKGILPNIPKLTDKELNSQKKSFIELGIKRKCKTDCKCEFCIKK